MSAAGVQLAIGAHGAALAPARGPGAPCGWCGDPIPARSAQGRRTRKDAKTCGVVCRQASARFGYQRAEGLASGRPMRFAYFDPPYPGMSWTYYREHPDYAGEVDHAALIARALEDFPDGWALSTSAKTLRLVLELVPADVDVRVMAWTKPMPPGKAMKARHGWEPVIVCGGRPRESHTLLDWHHAAPPRKLPGQVVGSKPASFSRWLFDCLGAAPGDELVDVFPGSGAVGKAWARYVGPADETRRGELDATAREDLRDRSDVSDPAPGPLDDASRCTACREVAADRNADGVCGPCEEDGWWAAHPVA